MGFFSGLGRGLRGILDNPSGTQAPSGGHAGAYAQLPNQQIRFRAAQATLEDARRKNMLDQLIMQGLDPAQAELALINPDFARRLLPGFGRPRSVTSKKFNMADPAGLEIEHGNPPVPAGLNDVGSQPDHRDGYPRRALVASPFPMPPQVDRFPVHPQNVASAAPAIAMGQVEPNRREAALHLAGQDGYDRYLEIGRALESARRTGQDYREILRQRRGLPSRSQQAPAQPAPIPPAGPSPRQTIRRAPPPDQSVAPPAPRQADDSTQRPPARTIRLTEADLLNLKRTLATEWVIRAGGPDQARGIIDTILNRLASGRWGSTVSEVVNQESQFSDINGPPAWRDGRHSVEEIPDSRVSQVVSDFVDTYLAERAEGRESSVGTHLNYANPIYSSPRNRSWIMALDGPVYGSGDAIHRHGTTPDRQRYRPEPYSIELPNPAEQ